MPTEKQPERGVRGPYQARYGITTGPCRGLNLLHDKSMIGDDELQDATNVRVADGIVVSRFGQSAPLNDDALPGCVQGLIDVNGSGARFVVSLAGSIDLVDRSLPLADAYIEVSSVVPLNATPSVGQVMVNGGTLNESEARYAFLWWNEQIIFHGAGTGTLYRLILPEDDMSPTSVQVEKVVNLTMSGSPADISSMCTLPATNPNAVASNDPRMGPPLYLGTRDGGVLAYVNGQVATLLADGTFAARVIVFMYHNRLYATGGGVLKVQTGWLDGDSAISTTWTDVVGGGIATAMCATEMYGYGWIGGSGGLIRLDDSSGVPVATSPAHGITNMICVDDFAIEFGVLYAAYRNTPSVTQVGVIGVVDSTGAIVGVSPIPNWSEDGQVARLVSNGSALYMAVWATSDQPPSIYEYDGTDFTRIANVPTPAPSDPLTCYDMLPI